MFSFTKSLLSRVIRGILQGKTLFFIFIFILFSSFLNATIINIPADQPTIQAGIDVSVDADTVLVQPGTYVENINYNGKLITVGSLFLTTQDTTYISSTIIDGNSSGRVVTFENGENSSAVLCGFTITNGNYNYGGGIFCNNSSNPSLENLIITGNIASYGGGICCYDNSNPDLQNVTISSNSASSYGGGIYIYMNSNTNLQNVIISNNFSNFFGGGIYCVNSSPSLENVTIAGNSASNNGGGIYCNNSGLSIINSIVWNDSPQEIYLSSGSVTVTYSDIQGGWTGTGNIDSDPLFVDPGNGDYHLQPSSPCIDAGDPASPLDPDGTITDMGAYYFHQYFGPVWHISTTGSDVTGDGSEQNPFATIQHGINISADTDTVLVQPGTYVENINYNGKHISIGSLCLTTQDTIYISTTIIDGNSSGSVVTFNNSEDSTAVLCGFTITNGLASGIWPENLGGGIYCYQASPCLDNLIISGNSADNGGGIYCNEYSSPILTNVTIIDNFADWGSGGGIFCNEYSSPIIQYVIISGNSASANGGGIYCFYYSDPSLENIIISDNSANYGGGVHFVYCSPFLHNVTISSNSAFYGGGISCVLGSSPSLINVTISENSASNGGGIYCGESSLSFENVQIIGNFATLNGGGISFEYGSPSIENVIITGNSATESGGGIYCYYNANPSFGNVTISDNFASYGGGIYCNNNSSPSFDFVNRCNIFLNFAGSGCDLYALDCPTIDVIIDTFTVIQPNNYFAYPIDNFTFDIFNAKVEQVNQDLYVSPYGSDDNSGLTVDDPLLTVSYALAKILADSTNNHTIYLSNGIYSPSQTVERFPLNCRSYISLLGEDKASTILDGEELSRILFCEDDNNFSIENMTIQNGSADKGGGIYNYESNPSLENLIISGNSANTGGGIYCEECSSPSLQNVIISGNSAGTGGGIRCEWFSSPNLQDVIISDNSAGNDGGGISCLEYSSPSLQNVAIINNHADGDGGGIDCFHTYSNFENLTIAGNSAGTFGRGDGIRMYSSTLSLLNCILWNDPLYTSEEIYIYEGSGSVTVTYSDIRGEWIGLGNINSDPLFVDPANRDYHLQSISPCINIGDPLSPLDPDGTRADIGAYCFNHTIGAPTISAVTDVPIDQGRSVIVTWQRSIWDHALSTIPIVNYDLWEMYPFELDRESIVTNNINKAIEEQDVYFQREDTTWVHIANVTAMQWEEYSALAETFFDSTTAGDYLSYFFVSAHTTNPSLYFNSSVASGYSVDNIAPDETRVYIAQNGSNIGLTWDEVEYGTFQGNSYPEINGIWYKIYAGDFCDFICDEAHLIDTVTNLNYDYPLTGEEKKFFKIVVSDQPEAGRSINRFNKPEKPAGDFQKARKMFLK